MFYMRFKSREGRFSRIKGNGPFYERSSGIPDSLGRHEGRVGRPGKKDAYYLRL